MLRRGALVPRRNHAVAKMPVQQIRKLDEKTRIQPGDKKTARCIALKALLGVALTFILVVPKLAWGTTLGDLAAKMQPETWAELTPNNKAVLQSLRQIAAYADSAVWDPVRRQLRFCGGYHADSLHCVVWDDATNSWSNFSNPTGSRVVHHAYDTNVIDPQGFMYYRETISNNVFKYDIALGTWSSAPSLPLNPSRCCGMLVHFPEYKGGGLVFLNNTFDPLYFLPDGGTQWEQIPNSSNLYTQAEATWHFGEYNPVHRFLVFGSGDRKLWKMSSTGQITPLRDMPIDIYDGGNGNFTVDPVSGEYLALEATSRRFHRYNPVNDTWQLAANQPPNVSPSGSNGQGIAQTPVSTYGITMYLVCGAASSVCDGRLLVYKNASGSAPPSPPGPTPSPQPPSVPPTPPPSSVPPPTASPTPPPLPPQTSADADFQARCNGSGVVKCVGFDNTATDIVQTINLRPADNGQFYGSLDTTTKASGAGALRFRLPAGRASANIAGQWLPPLTDKAMGTRTFGQNSEFYVQYRIRLSPEMFSNLAYWDSWWKQSIFHQDNASCAGIEITTNYRNYTGPNDLVPNFYTECGSMSFGTDPSTGLHKPSGAPPITQQQGDYNGLCNYPVWTNCWHYSSNEWITFYYHVKIGTWNQKNSQMEVWVSRPSSKGGAYEKIINVPDMTFTCNNNCGAGSTEGYNNITLTPYMTALSRSAPVDAFVWYDELIVSTQPIPAPGASPAVQPPAPGASPPLQPPAPPTNLLAR